MTSEQRTSLLCARACIASARQALADSIPAKQKVRNAKAEYAAFCLWLAAQEVRNAMTARVDARMQQVKCSGCSREYQCTPTDDYYNNTTLEDGVCERCLLTGAGFSDPDIARAEPDQGILARRPRPE